MQPLSDPSLIVEVVLDAASLAGLGQLGSLTPQELAELRSRINTIPSASGRVAVRCRVTSRRKMHGTSRNSPQVCAGAKPVL